MHSIHHIEAFTRVPGKGNPAGVVPDAARLDDETMQAIAKAVGFNETVFILPSENADHRFRYFTPGHEMPLCGHATVAAAHLLGGMEGKNREFTIETKAGILPVGYADNTGRVTMRQAEAEFRDFAGQPGEVARILGIDPAGLDASLPIVYGSTGTWTLLVPVRSKSILGQMHPATAAFPDILREMPRASVHPFAPTPETPEHDFYARHFSSPFSGTIEDPVTGTASGVMGAYAMLHIFPAEKRRRFVVGQGESVGRDGRVAVAVERRDDGMSVSISGTAAKVGMLAVD